MNLAEYSVYWENAYMATHFYKRLEEHLSLVGLTFQRLHYMAEIQTSQFSFWRHGKRRPSDSELKKLASVDQLGLTLERLRAWRAVDEYGIEALEAFIQELIDIAPERGLLLKVKAEALIKERRRDAKQA